MEYKFDLLTGEKFVPRRANQKFSTPSNRIKYYNRKANEIRHKAAFVNRPLHINLLILNEIMAKTNEKVFHKQYLLGKGMSFHVNTHCEYVHKEKYFAMYNYIIIPLQNDQIRILKNDR
jgi:hypothetical protein